MLTRPIKTGLSKTWFKINYIWNKIRKKNLNNLGIGHSFD